MTAPRPASDPFPAATRVRKARKNSAVHCGHYVTVGQVIVCRDGQWICRPCALMTSARTARPATTNPAPRRETA